MQVVFGANIVVAGTVGFLSLFQTGVAGLGVFSGKDSPGPAMAMTGAFWLAICLLSIVGLFFPVRMAPVLLLQLLYKGGWLLAFAAPAFIQGRGQEIPGGIAAFFTVWVVLLPFVIPWKNILSAS